MPPSSEPIDHRIVDASPDSIARAVEILSQGQLVGIPTETVYGLAANAWDADAVRRIFAAKNRPPTNPLIVHVAGVERLSDAIEWPVDASIRSQLELVLDFWPGPLTVVCQRCGQIPDVVTAGLSTVAVRIPSHPVALELLEKCPFPIAAPSANPSNYVSATEAAHVASGFGDSLSLILDGGPCRHGVESTIVSLDSEEPRLLRPGGIPSETLQERFASIGLSMSEKKHLESSSTAQPAPGMMKQHYSPVTPLVLLDGVQPHGDSQQQGDLHRTGRLSFRTLDPREADVYGSVEVLSLDGNATEIAQNLFSALRRLDALGLDRIHCDVCEEVGLGKAVMDRLRRAACQ